MVMLAPRPRSGYVNPLPRGSRTRRGAGAVDRGGLENRCTFAGTEGSNPSLSARDCSYETENAEFPVACGIVIPALARKLIRLSANVRGLIRKQACAPSAPCTLRAEGYRIGRVLALRWPTQRGAPEPWWGRAC